MASFFDDILKKVTNAGKDISDGLQKSTEAAKLQAKINAKNAECSELYQKIGELYYKSRLNNTQAGTEMAILCDQAYEANNTIAKLQGDLDKVRNISRCANCGNVIEANSVFCKHCGAKQPEKPAEEPVYEAPVAEEEPAPEEEPVQEEEPLAEEEAPAEALTPEDEIKSRVEQELAYADAPDPEGEPAKEDIETYVEPDDK